MYDEPTLRRALERLEHWFKNTTSVNQHEFVIVLRLFQDQCISMKRNWISTYKHGMMMIRRLGIHEQFAEEWRIAKEGLGHNFGGALGELAQSEVQSGDILDLLALEVLVLVLVH